MANYALIDFGKHEHSLVNADALSSHDCVLIVGESNSKYSKSTNSITFLGVENFYDYLNTNFSDEDYKYFLTIYELIDRCAQRWTVKNINHDDKFNIYFRGFCNSIHMLSITGTKKIFSGTSSPHHLYNLIFYYAALRLGIPTYFLNHIFISNRLIIVEGIQKKLWELHRPNKKNNLIENYIKQVRFGNVITPKYVSNYFSPKLNLRGIFFIFAVLAATKSLCRAFVDFLSRKKNISVTFIPVKRSYGIFFWLKILRNICYLPILKFYYKNKKISDIPKDNYIIFFAPYQPEASSQPDAELYSDPRLVLQHLKSCFPKNIKILYKEHPTKFLYFIQGFGTQIGDHRSIEYYRDLIKMGICLVDSKLDSKCLILNSQLVAGINGTFVIESVILGKPVVYYGNGWFAKIPFANKVSFDDKLSDMRFDFDKNYIHKIRKHLLRLESNSLLNIFGIASLSSQPGRIDDYAYEFSRILDI